MKGGERRRLRRRRGEGEKAAESKDE